MPGALRFRADRTFTIVQFTDLHWQNGSPEDLETEALMQRVLDAERPDFVVLTGDVIAGGGCEAPDRSWQRAVQPIIERDLPWAAVFGNHDDEGALGRDALMEVQQRLPGCLSQPGPEEIPGVGNYHLLVQGPGQDAPAAVLYFLDSGSYAPAPVGGYAWVHADQITWFRRLAAQLRAGHGTLPALAFFHIPLPEYDTVWETAECAGVKYENVCCPRLNSGLFTALYEAGGVLGTFVGHDHVNDYIGTLNGIRLCYGRAGGYHTYGRDGFLRGARVIRLSAGATGFETWLRLADGSRLEVQPQHAPSGRVLSA